MLQLRPNCECCDKDLPPASTEACICSYECTFCRNCVDTVLNNVCPNCGGGFCARPVRPATEHRPGVSLRQHPAATERVNSGYSVSQMDDFSLRLKVIAPAKR
ncbi:MAG: DUF1272 domain-containing protein [Motiliproteus sp.]